MPREFTHKQAEDLFNSIPNAHSASAEAWIDRLAALGLITIVPPKNPETPWEKLQHKLRLMHTRDNEIASLKVALEHLDIVLVDRKHRYPAPADPIKKRIQEALCYVAHVDWLIGRLEHEGLEIVEKTKR